MRRPLRVLAAGLALATAAAGSPAIADAADETSIGRLNHAGYRQRLHCTASLIAPDRALTAAHCVRGLTVPEMHFLPGYNRGIWREHLIPFAAVTDKGRRDVAVLCLADRAASPPLPVSGTGPKIGETLLVVGYPSPRGHAQSRITCTAGSRAADGGFVLNCPMRPGASGSPVMRVTDRGYEIVGVVSATNAARSIAYDVSGPSLPGGCALP